jgi:outer membrane protein OmpA-like peptidoglycan-associated protein
VGTTNTLLLAALFLQFGSQGPGTTVMPFFRVGQGPRAAAMGESYVGLADDATAIYWNPAGLGQLADYHLALSHDQWFSDIKDELLHAALPGGPGTFGLSLAYTGEPGIEQWNAQNEPGDTFLTWHGVLSAGYGARLARVYYLGAALKGFYQDLRTTAGYGGGLDMGFLARPLSFLSLGLAARNLGVGTGYGSDLEMLPAEASAGAGLGFDKLNAALDLVVPFDNNPALHLGAEYLPLPELAVRLGYRTGPSDLSTLGILSGMTAGLGVRVGALALDYSFTPYGKLGIAHRIGLSARFVRKGFGSLRVRTVDASNMQPVGADVALSGIKAQTVRTGRTGELIMTRLLPGTLILRTSSDGYLGRSDTMHILGDREQSAILALRKLEYGGLNGTVYDAATRRPLSGMVGYRGPVQGGLTTDPMLGNYTVKSVPSGRYVLSASGPTDDYVTQTCTLQVETGRIAIHDFYLVKRKQSIILKGINFETGMADILPQFEPVLAQAAEILKANPSITVELAGHTDPREIQTAQFPSNWELSQARAEAVRKHLVDKFGIADDRLSANGYADTQPIAPNDTQEGMARNRRVEFRITGQ